MTLDDVIRMAREAGYGWSMTDMHAPALERFAAMVAEAERKAILDILWDYAGRKDLTDEDQSLLTHLNLLICARGAVKP
jgi:hypothetical protein